MARYPVKSSAGFYVAVGASVLLIALGPTLLLASRAAPRVSGASLLMGVLLTALPGVLILLVYLGSASAHRVKGGRGEIVLFPTHVVLPATARGAPVTFPLHAVKLQLTEVRTSLNFIPVSAVDVLTISAGGQSRRLSSRLFSSREDLHRLIADIERVQRGEEHLPAPGAPLSGPRDELDDAIDRELEKL